MKANVNESKYRSKDFWTCSVLLAAGVPLSGLERKSGSITTFVLDISPTEAEKTITRHFNNELILPTKDLVEAVRTLKSRLHLGI
jgi:hypothetical protein